LIFSVSSDPTIDNYDSRGNPIHLMHDNLEPAPGQDPDLVEQPQAAAGAANPPNEAVNHPPN
jgi:hypothetical protein